MRTPGATNAPRSGDGDDGAKCLASSPAKITPCGLEGLSDAALVRQAQCGSDEALNQLFRRHWKLFVKEARQQCGSCGWVEDVCQEGCLKAVAHFSQLQHPAAFHRWVYRFIAHERRHCRRNCKKVGTNHGADGTSQMERLGVEPRGWTDPDRKCLWSALWEQTDTLREPQRRIAVFMLEFFGQHEEFPAVRVLAEVTHTSHGSAERSRVAVLRAWRHRLTSLELHH